MRRPGQAPRLDPARHAMKARLRRHGAACVWVAAVGVCCGVYLSRGVSAGLGFCLQRWHRRLPEQQLGSSSDAAVKFAGTSMAPRKQGNPPAVQLRAVADPWKVLGVQPGASMSEIKRAYRRRALKEHPDVNKAPDAKERWNELSQAYEVLSDPQKQKAWEAAQRGASSSGSARSGGRAWSSGSSSTGARQAAMDAQYDTGGDSLGAIFGDFLEGLGREVGGTTSPVGTARKVGAFVLEELLDFLEGGGSGKGKGMNFDREGDLMPDEELAFAKQELATLEQLQKSLQSESEARESEADKWRAAGDVRREREAMQKVFDARERRAGVRRRVLKATERVEYLEKVMFEYNKKKKSRESAQLEVPGTYTIMHDKTKVAATKELSEKWIAELKKGTPVRVLEVTTLSNRVRGRIDQPAGWISLRNMENGYRFASQASGGGSYSSGPAKPSFDADAALADLKKAKSR
eukprot:TRINITY_DN44566_c0_g2_i1.p1 TRINITY_DN44566_c0_g2~~TRINITY_DN44566_c0_g2_i1.p1  ORF type:complete len:463 (-),score=139.80 TRINITY_DN44566_c0_g2_i1:390-1778(-)